MEILKIVVGALLGCAFLFVVAAALFGEINVTYDWEPKGDSEGVNWHRCKLERWENERREMERRARDLPVDHERRGGEDRRKNQGAQ